MIENRYLNGTKMETHFNVDKAYTCGVLCRRKHGCLQANYHKTVGTCELHGHKIEEGQSADDIPDHYTLVDHNNWDTFVRNL